MSISVHSVGREMLGVIVYQIQNLNSSRFLDLEVTLGIIIPILMQFSNLHQTIPNGWAECLASVWASSIWGLTTLDGCLVYGEKLYLWESQHMVPSFEIGNESLISLFC